MFRAPCGLDSPGSRSPLSPPNPRAPNEGESARRRRRGTKAQNSSQRHHELFAYSTPKSREHVSRLSVRNEPDAFPLDCEQLRTRSKASRPRPNHQTPQPTDVEATSPRELHVPQTPRQTKKTSRRHPSTPARHSEG